MKRLLLLSLILLSGCGYYNKVFPNLATRLAKQYPRLQDICDSVGGCQNVDVRCLRYDGYGNTWIRNTSYLTIETGEFKSEDNDTEVYGQYGYPNDKPDLGRAINEAVTDYWNYAKWKETRTDKIIFPRSSDCSKDCFK